MKKLTLLLIYFTFISCQSQETNKELINSFIDNIVLAEKYEFYQLEDYINFNREVLTDKKKKKFIIELIDTMVLEIKTKLLKNSNTYKIVSHKELQETTIISNLEYDDYSKVFYIISKNKVITPFIIKNKKIISFFYSLTKNKSHLHPWMLNK